MFTRRGLLKFLIATPLLGWAVPLLGYGSPRNPVQDVTDEGVTGEGVTNRILREYIEPSRLAMIRSLESKTLKSGEIAYVSFIIREDLYEEYARVRKWLPFFMNTPEYKFKYCEAYDAVQQGMRLTYTYTVV